MSRQPARAGLGGEHRSRRQSPSTDFVDYRPYQPGDDFRRVDWNVYGRLGSLQVKLTEGRARLDVLLVLDCSSSMASGTPDKLSCAAQLVAALGAVGLTRSDDVRVITLTEEGAASLGPLRGRARLAELVQFVGNAHDGGRIDVETSLTACLPAERGRALVVVLSDLMTPGGMAAGLDALAGLDVVVAHVVSPDELAPRFAGEVELVDAESGEVLELGASMRTLQAYGERFRAWLDQQERACIGRGMRYARVISDRPLTALMLDDLRRAGVLR